MRRRTALLGLAAIGALAAFGPVGAAGAQDGPSITVTPDTGLSDGDEVQIEGSGYTPGTQLGVTQCSDQGDATGSGDCDLASIKSGEDTIAGDDGTVSTSYVVNAGPFGANERVCDADNACVLALGELSAEADVERASAPISFGDVTPEDEAAADEGSEEAAADDDELAATGIGLVPLVLTSSGLVGAGSGLLLLRRRRG